MTKKPSRPRDTNQLAKLIVDIATDESKDKATAAPAKKPPHKDKPKG